jgi:hypothetical protein
MIKVVRGMMTCVYYSMSIYSPVACLSGLCSGFESCVGLSVCSEIGICYCSQFENKI